MATSSKPVSKQKKTDENNGSVLDELEYLRKKVLEMESSNKSNATREGSEETDDIRLDDYIKVISLCPYTLTLSTAPRGTGKSITFRKFGEVKRVIYKELAEMMENHSEYTNFIEEGYCYIADKRVIRRHGLDEAYEKILTKEKIEQVLSGSPELAVSLFNSASDAQKKIICDMMIVKVASEENINMNLVDSLSRASGVEIKTKALEAKSYNEMNIQKT